MVRNAHHPNTDIARREAARVLWFDTVGIADIALVGGKNASLGEMRQQLQPQGVNVPNGFATTAYAYQEFITAATLDVQLRQIFSDLDVTDINNLQERGKLARALILNTPFPQELEAAIASGYLQLCQEYGENTDVAVRSSATAEDLPDASFAGQQETFLNVRGVDGVLAACKRCFASLFTDRAISYRHTKGFDHFQVAIAVGVQKMVRSDLASAGVMFSIEPESGFADVVVINAAYGLGENVVQGNVNPDEYYVFKPRLNGNYRPIVDKKLGSKAMKMVYVPGINSLNQPTHLTENIAVPQPQQKQFALTDDEILLLGRWACLIESHYTSVHGSYTPMDMEWAKDGITQELFIVQARPETVQSQKQGNILRTYRFTTSTTSTPSQPLVEGSAVGDAIASGKVRVIDDIEQMHLFQPGEILVAQRTDPDWEPIMKQAKAIVTDQGGRTCHAAIIARELGVPAIVGCNDATQVLTPGQEVTISCAEGDRGFVYDGMIPFTVEEVELDSVPRPRTQILMNVGNPHEAFKLAAIPNDGVGLARTEFIIANQIQVHPLALINFHQVEDTTVQAKINKLTAGYADKPAYFVEKLAFGIGRIAAAFYPKPVIVRMSDFKSNEYANLLGGKQFEPEEENPMLGWRGASRYYDAGYRDGFALECQAFKIVRDVMGLTNLIPMIPFCRTPAEGELVLAEMAKNGLCKGENGLQVYVMCELPNNVILADEFAEIFDGFSIGSNDLTQLTLGLDRDSSLVARIFDERSAGVKTMVKMVIAAAKRKHRKIGICGQAPSDYPEFAEFLVQQGIDSISLNPDSVLKTILAIVKVEAC